MALVIYLVLKLILKHMVVHSCIGLGIVRVEFYFPLVNLL